jgi:cytochrome P450
VFSDLCRFRDGRKILTSPLSCFSKTTAHTIAWAMLELAKNPKEQKNLRDALRKYAKTCDASTGETPDLKLCSQVKMVTREVLRLHPAAALGSTRVAPKEYTVFNPDDKRLKYIIPKGSFCCLIYYVILRNHLVFGDNVDEFDPSRWERPTEEMLLEGLYD